MDNFVLLLQAYGAIGVTLSMLCPASKLTLTVVEPLEKVPATGPLTAVTGAPPDGVTVTLIVEPTGIFVVAKLIVTGFDWLAEKVTSAAENSEPRGGLAGTVPAMETTVTEDV